MTDIAAARKSLNLGEFALLVVFTLTAIGAPLALFLGLVGLTAFLWSLRNGQYDDMDGAALRVLDDSDIKPGGGNKSAKG